MILLALEIDGRVNENGWRKVVLLCKNEWKTALFIERLAILAPNDALLGKGYAPANEVLPPADDKGLRTIDPGIRVEAHCELRPFFFVRTRESELMQLEISVRRRWTEDTKWREQLVKSVPVRWKSVSDVT